MSPALEAALRLTMKAREEGLLRTHERFIAPPRQQGKQIGAVLPADLVDEFKRLRAMLLPRIRIMHTMHIGAPTFARLLQHCKRRK